ncbi:uncharacterized protein LOC117333739 [Pecten maximus]|uniref:uncharacterized protein LOC117333739 n=1 Tax=Pecten maximus TaxID=6579 RepID=UPI001458D133|nr:uncharacterized protein LOC117333739 [Pecten maximus]
MTDMDFLIQVIWTIFLLQHVTVIDGYSDKRLEDLEHGIMAYYQLFAEYNPTFNSGDPTLTGFKHPDLFKKDRRDIRYDSTYVNKTCKPANLHKTSELRDSSTCPWYTKVGFDVKRIPVTIPVAGCLCESCAKGCCREFYINVPVLRLYKGKHVPTLEPVSVACLCQHMTGQYKQATCGKVNKHTHSKKKRRRRKHKKRRSYVTMMGTRELIWWRYKNCMFYRYCKF